MSIASSHSIKRYQERVEPLSPEAAQAALQGYEDVIARARAFGCSTVRLGNGHRLVLADGGTIITVLPKYAKGHTSQRTSRRGGRA